MGGRYDVHPLFYAKDHATYCMTPELIVSDDEDIVRILHREWVVEGKIQLNAFSLRPGESYISVNRPIVDTYEDDVSSFVNKHLGFKISDSGSTYQRARMKTGLVRETTVSLGKKSIKISVEVEARSMNFKSHAGVFTRYKGKNIKKGQDTMLLMDEGKHIPIPAILQKVQHHLLKLSTLEVCPIK